MAKKHKKRRRRSLAPRKQHSVGEVPGTLRAEPGAPRGRMHVIAYGPEKLVERACPTLAEVKKVQKRKPHVLWLDVVGLGDADQIQRIGEHFGLHRLALEDVLSGDQRPKFEPYDRADFFVAKMAKLAPHEEGDHGVDVEQVGFFLGDGFVITFQEREGDVFEPVRRRIRRAAGQVRTQQADYLFYALLDAVVDNVFPIVETISRRLEDEEDSILRDPQDDVAERLYDLRRELILLRRALWPMREAISSIQRATGGRIRDETKIYLRDVEDHAIKLVDLLESEREVVATLMDVYLTQVSHRMNEVMKVLTIIATIFIPLGFMAGLRGMNFEAQHPANMPELGWRFGYPAALSAMALVALGMVIFFRRKKWI